MLGKPFIYLLMSKSIIKNSHISKNDKAKANQQDILNDFNTRINKKLKQFNNSSETARATSFNEWLGGLMDSDGCFYLSKKNYLSCEITVPTKELESLIKIKSKFGGSVSKRSNVNAWRWRLHKKELLELFLKALNGNIFLKASKYKSIMQLYLPDVPLITKDFSVSNGWFSGFFEGDGHINLNKVNYSLSICVGQKDRTILDIISSVFGGNVFYDKTWNGYTWQASSQIDLTKLLEYFTLYPLVSNKNSEVFSAKKFFRYKLNKYHLDTEKRKILDNFIKIFQDRKKI